MNKKRKGDHAPFLTTNVLRFALDQSQDAILILDGEIIQHANRKALDFLGGREEHVIGANVGQLRFSCPEIATECLEWLRNPQEKKEMDIEMDLGRERDVSVRITRTQYGESSTISVLLLRQTQETEDEELLKFYTR